MPALITHHIFGESIVTTLPEDIVDGEEELLAFLLGNQGPDPLLARLSTRPRTARACHRLAGLMQTRRPVTTLLALRDGVRSLPSGEARVGRAFALGMLGHYALDREAHPFVIAQQRGIVEADPTLSPLEREVHAIIESDLDVWVLREFRQATVEERPAASNLMRTERVGVVAGALVSQVALSAHGVAIDALEYPRCVRDYERVYWLADPAGSLRSRVAGGLERALLGSSLVSALAHRTTGSDECPAANLSCLPWRHPFSGEVREDSFADLFDAARLAYPGLAEAFTRGDADRIAALVGGVNHEGRVVGEE